MPSDRLTELGIRKCTCGPKQKKMTDGKGLFLLLHPNGSKYWRMKYQFSGKEKTLAFGVWPQVSLTEAREMRNEAKLLLKDGKRRIRRGGPVFGNPDAPNQKTSP